MAKRKQSKIKEETKKSIVEEIKKRENEIQRILAAAEAYFSEFSLFSLPPEIELRARPELYVTAVWVPSCEEFRELREQIEQFSKGSDNSKDVEASPQEIRKLFEDYSFNLPLRQAHAVLKWDDKKFIVLEVSQTLKREGKIEVRIRKQDYLSGLTTALVKEYDSEMGLIGNHERE
ncbi:MAG TPA: hypothetical protein VNM22_06800 [Candidatus Limnocylindrales bacterium]|nr:hypothetical protein [Candidatus Limnocylindrales bacterium]